MVVDIMAELSGLAPVPEPDGSSGDSRRNSSHAEGGAIPMARDGMISVKNI